jgi:glycosyltransferase involved in cell wall biosynthesis
VGIDLAVVVRDHEGAALVQGQHGLSDRDLDRHLNPWVAGAAKAAFLGGAAALLFPIRWPEPFGLVMPEALACGTPVLALRRGSVPEVIEDGLTGFVVDEEEELVDAVTRLPALSRVRCRQAAETRFSLAVMADHYVEAYRALIAQRDDERIAHRTG